MTDRTAGRTGFITLQYVVQELRANGRFVDDEGEATNSLDDLLTDLRTQSLPAAAQPAAITDGELVRLVFKHFATADAHGLAPTVWKDGIDIEVPSYALKALIADVCRATPPAGDRDAVDVLKELAMLKRHDPNRGYPRPSGTLTVNIPVALLARIDAAVMDAR